MRALDGAVCYACVNTETPGITIREYNDGKLWFLVHALYDAPCTSRRLSLQVYKDGIELFIKPVLDEPVLHTAGLDGDNELRIMLYELYCLYIIGDLVSGFSNLVLAVHGTVTAFC